MDLRERLIILISFFIIAFVFWRLEVFFLYNDGNLPFFRAVTGLTFHHYHYGMLIILFASLMLIFFKRGFVSIALMGFGLGSIFDSFVSRLFGGSNRIKEISAYNFSFNYTLALFIAVILLFFIFYIIAKNKENIKKFVDRTLVNSS